MLFALLLALQDPAVDRLGSEDPEVRESAECELASRGGRAIPALLGALKNADPEIRGRAGRLLEEQSPLDWAPYFDDAEAFRRFQGALRNPLIPEWRDHVRAVLDDTLAASKPLPQFVERVRAHGHVVWTVGALRRSNGDNVTLTWQMEANRDLYSGPDEVNLIFHEGVIVAGYRRDLGRLKPFARLLVERLLEEPIDAQAACLLADMVQERMRRGLVRSAERQDAAGRAAFEVLTYVLAKKGAGDGLDPGYVRHVSGRLKTAGWDFLRPFSHVAKAHPRAVAPALKEAYASPNRWARYLGAATANLTKEPALFDPALFALMREKQPDLQREALGAAFSIAACDRMDFEAMVGAALAQKDRWPAIQAFRKIPERRLGLEVVRHIREEWDFAMNLLTAFDDDAVTDAFCEAVDREIERPEAERTFPILEQYAAVGRRRRPIESLKRFAEKAEEPVAFRALATLAPLLREEGVELFAAWTASERETIRRRGVEGLSEIASIVDPGSCLHEELVTSVAGMLAREIDPATRKFAQERLDQLTGRAKRPYVGRMHGRRSLVSRCGCGGGQSYRIGWQPVVEAAIPTPEWK